MMKFTLGIAIFIFTVILGIYQYMENISMYESKQAGLEDALSRRDEGKQLEERIRLIRQPRNFGKMEISDFLWHRANDSASFAHGDDPISEAGHRGLGVGTVSYLCRRNRARHRLWHGLSRLANLLGLPDPANECRRGGF